MQSKTSFGLAVAALFLVVACTNSYNRIETGGTERTSVRLDESAAVLITMPKDGRYNDKVFSGSGAIVARRTDAAFSRYARLVDVYPGEYHSLNELKGAVEKNGYGYIVVPTINVWGRKDSEWSKIPNQVAVKISVIDTMTGREVSSNFLEGKDTSSSGLHALLDPNGEGPEEIFSESVDDYADTLYGVILPFPIR